MPRSALLWRRAAALGAVAALVPLGLAAPGRAATASYGDANLLTGETVALSRSTGLWQGHAASLSLPADGVLGLTSATTSWMAAVTGATTPAAPQRVYSGQLSVRAASQARQVAPTLQFFDATGKVLLSVQGQLVSDPSSTWTLTEAVVGVAPPGTTSVALGEVVGSPDPGEVHFLRRPVLTVAPDARRDVVGPLHTSGNQVVDANGPVVLRGIHRRGLEQAGSRLVTGDEIAQAKLWGATMVRLSVSSAYWLSTNCSYKPGYPALVDQAVEQVTAQGMVALVDLHTNSAMPCGTVKQQVMADSTAPRFWRQVAARYASNPLVAFDLYNEPHDVSDQVWLHGGRVISMGTAFQVAGMQDMYDAVRSVGATNLVFVSGNGWANRLPDELVDGTDIVYGVHVYTCPISTDPAKCQPNPLDPSPILRLSEAASQTVPVVITEFGWPSTTDGRYAANVIDFAARHGWGWISFAWDGQTLGDFSLLSRAVGTYEPSPAGMPVLAGLRFS